MIPTDTMWHDPLNRETPLFVHAPGIRHTLFTDHLFALTRTKPFAPDVSG